MGSRAPGLPGRCDYLQNRYFCGRVEERTVGERWGKMNESNMKSVGIDIGVTTVGLWLIVAAFTYGGIPSSQDLWLQRADFGQFVAEMILIPVAAAAFFVSREALKDALAKPELRLRFLDADGVVKDDYTVFVPEGFNWSNGVTLALENVGDAIAVWWQVSFYLPMELIEAVEEGKGDLYVRDRTQVRISNVDTVGDVRRYTVQSEGSYACFPRTHVEIAKIDAFRDPNTALEPKYQIRYEIMTERTKRVSGKIPLKFEEE